MEIQKLKKKGYIYIYICPLIKALFQTKNLTMYIPDQVVLFEKKT